MDITAQLDQLSTAEKLRTMEYLWDDLCSHADDMPAPAWHGDVLAERERAVASGGKEFRDWEAEKTRIRDLLK